MINVALSFPLNPEINDTYTYAGVVYVWDGISWNSSMTIGGTSNTDDVPEGNTNLYYKPQRVLDLIALEPYGGITAEQIAHWEEAYGWGDHTELYATIGHTQPISSIIGLQTQLDGLGGLISANIYVSETPPEYSTEGLLWWSPSTDADSNLKIYYIDEDGTEQWVDAVPIVNYQYNGMLPAAIDLLGGIMADTRTTETVEVKIDTINNRLYVPTYPQGNVQADWDAVSGDAVILNKPTSFEITFINGLQDALDAKVDDSQVLTDVPVGAVFTDTVYIHPSTHSATIIVEDATHRFVTDTQVAAWDAKSDAHDHPYLSDTYVPSYLNLTDVPSAFPPTVHGHVIGDITDFTDNSVDWDAAYGHAQSVHAPIDAEANVQADWAQSDVGADDYIKHKPTLLVLGTTDSTAFAGDQGLVAYNHSQLPHAPSNAEANPTSHEIAFIVGLQAALDGKAPTHDHPYLLDTWLPSKAELEGILVGEITTHTHPNNDTWRDVVDDLVTGGSTVSLSAEQGVVLKGFIDNINTLLSSDDTTLDELQEVVDFIKANKDTLDALGISNIAGLQDALDSKLSGTELDDYKAIKALQDVYDTAYSQQYSEITYVNGDPTQVDVWTDNTKTTKLFTTVITYTNGDITQAVTTNNVTGEQLTKTIGRPNEDTMTVLEVIT